MALEYGGDAGDFADEMDDLRPRCWRDPSYVAARREELNARFIANMPAQLREVLALYKEQATGVGSDLWLIGSTIPLVIEGIPHERDYDLITSGPVSAPRGWSVERNKYGNPKHRKGGTIVDIVPIDTIYSIHRRRTGQPPRERMGFTIENFLTGTPMAQQSVAYDAQREELLGDVGIFAIATRTVFPNDVTQLAYYAAKKGKTCNALIAEHAKRLGYTPLFAYEPLLEVFLPPCAMHPRM